MGKNGHEFLVDVWETADSKWNVVEVDMMEAEEASAVDGFSIIGKFDGQFFVPNGISQNNRSYKDVWEYVLESDRVKEKINNRMMFGTIGHEDKLVDEKDLREGRVSHIVTNLDKGSGNGEAVILGTETGKNLLTYLKAGAQLRPSSRAYGKYLPNAMDKGKPVVDKKTYLLETFDLVINPGFKETGVTLAESLSEKETNMDKDKDYVQFLTEDRDKMQKEIVALASEKEKLEESLADLKVQLEKVASEKEQLKKETEDKLADEREKVQRQVSEAQEILGKFETLEKLNPTTEDFDAIVDIVNANGYRDFREFADDLQKVDLKTFATLGEDFDVREILHRLAEFEDIGEPDEIEETARIAREVVTEYSEIGSPDEINEAIELATERLGEYKELGTPDEIHECLRRLNSLREENEKNELEDKVLHYSEKFELETEDVRDVLSVMSEDKAENIFERMRVGHESPRKVLSDAVEDDSVINESSLSARIFRQNTPAQTK